LSFTSFSTADRNVRATFYHYHSSEPLAGAFAGFGGFCFSVFGWGVGFEALQQLAGCCGYLAHGLIERCPV
jgi:hypothetical protein